MTFKQSLVIAAASIALAGPAWAAHHESADESVATDVMDAAAEVTEDVTEEVTETIDEATDAVDEMIDGETDDATSEMSETVTEVTDVPTPPDAPEVEPESVVEDATDVVTDETPDVITDAADAVVPPTPSVEVVAPAAAVVTDRVTSSVPSNTTSVVTDLTSIRSVLASDIRDEDRARDEFRNPVETLSFFGIKPDMTVGEYAPGGGWYTRILAPYLSGQGKYVGINHDIDAYMADAEPERFEKAKAWSTNFPGQVSEWTGVPAESVTAFEADEIPEGMEGSLDAVVVFRSLHGLYNREIADSAVRDFYTVLKPGGIVGVVQHRAKEDAPHAYVDGSNGYLKQSEVIALFKSQGFVAAKQSDINANPNDPANWEGGVWTLPPVLRYGDENRDEYTAIGESDRMTLVFRKPE